MPLTDPKFSKIPELHISYQFLQRKITYMPLFETTFSEIRITYMKTPAKKGNFRENPWILRRLPCPNLAMRWYDLANSSRAGSILIIYKNKNSNIKFLCFRYFFDRNKKYFPKNHQNHQWGICIQIGDVWRKYFLFRSKKYRKYKTFIFEILFL